MTGGIRLTGGRFASRMIAAPAGLTRPSAARARRALFDMLVHRIGLDFAVCPALDIFAGAGTLGFEALSRGAPHVVFVDHRRAVLKQIIKNAQILNVARFCHPLYRDALRPMRRPRRFLPVRLVFADAPYRSDLAAASIAAFDCGGWLDENVVLVIEEDIRHQTKSPEGFVHATYHKAGGARFDIYYRR